MKGDPGGHGKDPLKRLRFDLDGAKLPLFRLTTAIWAVPIAIVNQLPTFGAGHAPVRYLMKSAGKKAMSKEDPVAATMVTARQVLWVRWAKAQARSIPCEEQAIEQIDDLLRLPCDPRLALEHPHIY